MTSRRQAGPITTQLSVLALDSGTNYEVQGRTHPHRTRRQATRLALHRKPPAIRQQSAGMMVSIALSAYLEKAAHDLTV